MRKLRWGKIKGREFIAGLMLTISFAASTAAAELSADVRQLIVSIAPDWSTTRGSLQRFERNPEGKWIKVGAEVPVLYGKSGLAWGRGVFGTDETGLHKQEGDGRSPAGIFELGIIYGNDESLPSGANYPYHRVTDIDAWIDDPTNPLYNQHVVIDPKHPPTWFEKEHMRLGDPAYHWLVEVKHNANPPLAGAGSAIFLHVRRGETRPTAGCTSMAEDSLRDIVSWLRAERRPHYVLLPKTEYARVSRSLGLPEISTEKTAAEKR